MASKWFVYLVRCNDQSLYTGITTDPTKRIAAHNSKAGGAKYTRARQPVSLVYVEEAASRSAASKREYVIKQMTVDQKNALIAGAGENP